MTDASRPVATGADAAPWPDPPWSASVPDGVRRRRAAALSAAMSGEVSPAGADLAARLRTALAERDEALRALNRTRASASYRLGTTLASARRPKDAIRLPGRLLRLLRGRRATPAPVPAAPAPPPTVAPESLFTVFDAASLQARERPLALGVLPQGMALRLGTSLLDVEPARPSGASLSLGAARPDLLVVACSAGRRGAWFGLGTGAAPERDRDLNRLLDQAARFDVPRVLVVDEPLAVLPTLAALGSRFDAVVGDDDGLWDAGLRWDWEAPIGPQEQSDLLVLDAHVADASLRAEAAGAAAGTTVVAAAPAPYDVRDGWAVDVIRVEGYHDSYLGSLVRGARRVVLPSAASGWARRLAEVAGADSAAGARPAVRRVAGRYDTRGRTGQVLEAAGLPAPAAPMISLVAEAGTDPDRAPALGAAELLRLGSADAPDWRAAVRRAAGDLLIRAGEWTRDPELVADVLATARYADAVAVGAHGVVLVRRHADGSGAPWSPAGQVVDIAPARR